MPDDKQNDEVARLRAEHRQISDLLGLIQELTSRVVRSESAADLFGEAFPTLDAAIEDAVRHGFAYHPAPRTP